MLPHSFSTSALNGGRRTDSGPGRFTLAKSCQKSPCNRPRGPRWGENCNCTPSFNLGTKWGWVVNATPQPLYPGNEPVPNVYEAGWAPGPIKRVRKISAPLRFDPRTVRESLHRRAPLKPSECYQNAQTTSLGRSAYAGLAELNELIGSKSEQGLQKRGY